MKAPYIEDVNRVGDFDVRFPGRAPRFRHHLPPRQPASGPQGIRPYLGLYTPYKLRDGVTCASPIRLCDVGRQSSRFPPNKKRFFVDLQGWWPQVLSSGAFSDSSSAAITRSFSPRARSAASGRTKRWAIIHFDRHVRHPQEIGLGRAHATPAPWFHAQHGQRGRPRTWCNWASAAGSAPAKGGERSAVTSHRTCSRHDICDMGLEAACRMFAIERCPTDGTDCVLTSPLDIDCNRRRFSCLVPAGRRPAAAAARGPESCCELIVRHVPVCASGGGGVRPLSIQRHEPSLMATG